MSTSPTNEGIVKAPEVETAPEPAAAGAESTIAPESNAAEADVKEEASAPFLPPPQRSPTFLAVPVGTTGGTQGYSYWGAPPEGRPGASSPSQIVNNKIQDIQQQGCTCKKTRCLKMYCQCFAVKMYCGNNCRCMSCYNIPSQEKSRSEAIRLILSRNPNAFDAKFASTSEVEPGKPGTPMEDKTLLHKIGCKCRKSGCMKKYCECFAAGLRCTSNCRCVGCKNLPGGGAPPPGSTPTGALYSEASRATPNVSTTPAPTTPGSVYPTPAAGGPPFLNHMHPSQVMQQASAASGRSIQAAQNLALLKQESPLSKEGGVNALAIAAYAMTEYGQGSLGRKNRKRPATLVTADV